MSEFRLCYVDDNFAWFTTCEPFHAVSGDDFDDAPYECNASGPYEWAEHLKDVAPYELMRVAYSGNFATPAEHGWSVCVNDINAGAVAWLTGWDEAAERPIAIRGGATLEEFKRLIWQGDGSVYTEEISS